MVKDNIMKLTDGLFHRVFKEVAAEYTGIESNSQIIDIGSARLANTPNDYDVIVTSNLYGDIISDIAAEIAGSVGMAGSANVGTQVAMFEAIHGSAPDISGRGIANPSGLLNGAVMMLAHLGQTEVADRVRNAWLATIEAGDHTADIYNPENSKRKLSTAEFADAVISRIGQTPRAITASALAQGNGRIELPAYQRKIQQKQLQGVDVFIDWQGTDPQEIGSQLAGLGAARLKLKMITNRGVKVYPSGRPETYCTDHWRCRFVGQDAVITSGAPVYTEVDPLQIIALLSRLHDVGFDVIKTENLYAFDGRRSFSLGQGE